MLLLDSLNVKLHEQTIVGHDQQVGGLDQLLGEVFDSWLGLVKTMGQLC